MSRAIRLIPFICWFGIILYLSFTPLTGWPKLGMFEKLYADKLVHITMYAILCFLFLFGLARSGEGSIGSKKLLVYAVVFCAGTGICIEILQPLLTRFRQFEWLDMIANAIGAGVGAYAFSKLISRRFLQQALQRPASSL